MLVRHVQSCVLTYFRSCHVNLLCNALGLVPNEYPQYMPELVPSELCSISAGVVTQRASDLLKNNKNFLKKVSRITLVFQ